MTTDQRTEPEDVVDQLMIAAASTDGALRVRLMNQAAEQFMPVAEAIAGRYRGRGIPDEDLSQVAALALVKATRGYRADRATRFSAYAVPTITGELRRHFRDHGWDIRPTRRLQELRIRFRKATAELTSQRGSAPSLDDLALYLGAEVREIREMLVAGEGYTAVSLDAPLDNQQDVVLADTLGIEDAELAEVIDRLVVDPLLAALPEHERNVLALRFYADWTQAQIATELGITQMQVSRTLARTLNRLHQATLDIESHQTRQIDQ